MYQRYQLSHQDAYDIISFLKIEMEKLNKGGAAAVVDSQGELLAFLRIDGCRLSSITIAMNKAYTAAREQVATKDLGEASKTYGFSLNNFGELRYTGWGGGLPVRYNGEVIGAVGISGLPESDDINLATAAIARFEQAHQG